MHGQHGVMCFLFVVQPGFIRFYHQITEEGLPRVDGSLPSDKPLNKSEVMANSSVLLPWLNQ